MLSARAGSLLGLLTSCTVSGSHPAISLHFKVQAISLILLPRDSFGPKDFSAVLSLGSPLPDLAIMFQSWACARCSEVSIGYAASTVSPSGSFSVRMDVQEPPGYCDNQREDVETESQASVPGRRWEGQAGDWTGSQEKQLPAPAQLKSAA